MAEGRRRAVRESLAAQAALVWGHVGDVGAYIESGRLDAPPASLGQAPPLNAYESFYLVAIERAGKFIISQGGQLQIAPDIGNR
jgi:hypothetical protein